MKPQDAVLNIQSQLRRIGLYTGKLDGDWGQQSASALQRLIDQYESEAPAEVGEFDENTKLLIQELEREEGCVLHAYPDHLGYLTIGIGRLIDKRKGGGISREEADYLKANDIRRIQAHADRAYPEWRKFSPTRQRAFQNMCFQLGQDWPTKFAPTWERIRAGKYEEAASRLGATEWARQTPERAKRVIAQWRKG